MKYTILLLSILTFSCQTLGFAAEFKLQNSQIARTLEIKKGKLSTKEITNLRNSEIVKPINSMEFVLHLSQGTDKPETDFVLNSNDFEFTKVIIQSSTKLGFLLRNKRHGMEVKLFYELESQDFFIKKYAVITSNKDITLENITLENLELDDVYQPYQMKQITSRGAAKWRPGLGQPLYTSKSALFLGTEFPASSNTVTNKVGSCGYDWGRGLKKGVEYTTYKAVIGAGSNPEMIQDDFFAYINKIRIRPLRLQVQYNSWFDYTTSVSKENFAESVSKVHEELVHKRSVPALKAYVIDDGWQDTKVDWSKKTWQVNNKFDSDFGSSFKLTQDLGSNLGLWLSPGLVFNGKNAVDNYRKQNFEVLDQWMSMAGPKYMQLLENRLTELTKSGVTYFKLDGVFGHLNIREFELHGEKYGIPSMPQLKLDNVSARDSILNKKEYDELKTYYLVAGTERLMTIFEKMHQVNPDVYVVISNGAYLSPWWLQYIDTVWMINAGDAAGGSTRTEELVYRDGVYFDTWVKEKTQFPINSVFNHEPKKRKTGEDKKVFSDYLLMNISRGTGFIELYIKTEVLSEKDWDVMADGLKWAHKIFPYFNNPKMHGGDPKANEVYGYSGWNENGGYISIHNPSDTEQSYTLRFNQKLGMNSSTNQWYTVSSQQGSLPSTMASKVKYGEEWVLKLKPKEISVLEFSASK